jgi:hypothetical protein
MLLKEQQHKGQLEPLTGFLLRSLCLAPGVNFVPCEVSHTCDMTVCGNRRMVSIIVLHNSKMSCIFL